MFYDNGLRLFGCAWLVKVSVKVVTPPLLHICGKRVSKIVLKTIGNSIYDFL